MKTEYAAVTGLIQEMRALITRTLTPKVVR